MTISKAREILGSKAIGLTDEEIQGLIDQFAPLVRLAVQACREELIDLPLNNCHPKNRIQLKVRNNGFSAGNELAGFSEKPFLHSERADI